MAEGSAFGAWALHKKCAKFKHWPLNEAGTPLSVFLPQSDSLKNRIFYPEYFPDGASMILFNSRCAVF